MYTAYIWHWPTLYKQQKHAVLAANFRKFVPAAFLEASK